MGEICPACQKAELKELVPGIKQCPGCRKIFKGDELPEEKVEKSQDEIKDGTYWMENSGLNPKWEVADSGITVVKDVDKNWIAVLLCHSPDSENLKYIRISWWKKSINIHAGMFKISELDELDNVILALERLENDFDDYFEPKNQITYAPIPGREEASEMEEFDLTKHICPKCNFKMKKSKNRRYYECEHCGELIVLEEGKPIYDIPNSDLALAYSTNFPINYYLPNYGITTNLHMGDWKAIVIIHKKENPDKKWLRFYWWQRDLQNYIRGEFTLGISQGLKWEAKKGLSSPNIYEKDQLPKLIDALKKMRQVWIYTKEENRIKQEEEKKKRLEKQKSVEKKTKISSEPAKPYKDRATRERERKQKMLRRTTSSRRPI